MSVLVTGGAGFIGSHIVDELLRENIDTVVLDNLSTGSRSNLSKGAVFVEGDIREPSIEKIFTSYKIDAVIHQAAQASVAVSMKDPMLDLTTNIGGSINLLNLAKKYNVKKFLAASTAAVYGVPLVVPINESHRTEPLSVYGISKLTMESYIKNSGIDYIITRYANVYGPRQDSHGEAGVVSIFVDKCINRQAVEIHGDGKQTRDFIFVKDIAKANVLLMKSEHKNLTVNIATRKSISVNELYGLISLVSGCDLKPVMGPERVGDIKDSVLDNSVLKKLVGYDFETPLEDGLKTTVNWFRNR